MDWSCSLLLASFLGFAPWAMPTWGRGYFWTYKAVSSLQQGGREVIMNLFIFQITRTFSNPEAHRGCQRSPRVIATGAVSAHSDWRTLGRGPPPAANPSLHIMSHPPLSPYFHLLWFQRSLLSPRVQAGPQLCHYWRRFVWVQFFRCRRMSSFQSAG